MPDNEVEDRVHNFFAQEDLSSGRNYLQAAERNWQGQGDNLWAGSQSHIGLSSSNSKVYNLQQSDIGRGQNSHSFQVANGFGQPNVSHELAKSHSQSQSPNLNGYMHSRQFQQTRQNEANFLGVDTESDRHNNMTSRGLSVYKSQGENGFENNIGSVTPKSSESRKGFDFLGGQQQMNGQKIGVRQFPPQQLSGFNDMQLFQNQTMLRKMQELQKQHLETSQNNSSNQNPSIINGTPILPFSSASNNTRPTEPSSGNTSWLHRATQAAQGPPNKFIFSPEKDQTPNLMGFIPQQNEQSFYGVPVSNTTQSHYSHFSIEKDPMQQRLMHFNASPDYQYTGNTDQVNVQPGSLSSMHGFRNGISSPENAVALDPTEEKILFGDGNIWDSFGDNANIREGGGSWSALMQSAVAETSSDNLGVQEESMAPYSDNINFNKKSLQGMPGFQQSVSKYPYEHGDIGQIDSPQRLFHHSTVERRESLSHGSLQKPAAEGAPIYENATNSSDAKILNVNSMPGRWPPQQNVYDKHNGRDDIETASSNGNKISSFYGNGNNLQWSGSTDHNKMIHGDISQDFHLWKATRSPQSTSGMEHSEMKENSSDSHRSNISQNNTVGSLKASGSHKFQCHPIRDLDKDVESSLGRKYATNNQNNVYSEQSKIRHFSKTSNELGKCHMFSAQQNKKGANDSLSRETLVVSAPNNSVASDRNLGIHASVQAAQSSQNLLGFFHDVDQSKENSKPDGSVVTSSHGFGLQLGFPSQNLASSSHSSPQLATSRSSPHTTPEIKEKYNFAAQPESLPSLRETSKKEVKRNEISGTGPRSNDGSLNSPSISESPFTRCHQNYMSGQPPNNFPPGIFRPAQLNNSVKNESDVSPSNSASIDRDFKAFGRPPNNFPLGNFHPGQLNNSVKNQSDVSPSNSASTDRDFEAFGRSLIPNKHPNPTYSLLNQMKAMRSTETNPNNRGLETCKGADSIVISGDPKNIIFAKSTDLKDNISSPQLATGRMESGDHHCNNNTISSAKFENAQISPQMAPSWFGQLGTFKNGQISVQNSHKDSTFKTMPLLKSSDTTNNIMKRENVGDTNQAGNIRQMSIPTPVTAENLHSVQLIAQDVDNKEVIAARKKKRKCVATLPAWHKEVAQGSQSHLTASMAEVEWAEEAHRLIDKVKDESIIFEDGPPSIRYKRRLIFTTQLMQQLYRPPVAAILSSDAYSNYEAVACMGARLALKDACNLIPFSENDSCAPLDSENSLTEPKRNRCFSEVTEHFIGRAKKLEKDFMRLDKRASVVELRVESQDLERISVINRFARVHGRSQADSVPRGPQRYVNAQPVPRVLPERVQCLSI